MQTVHMQCGSEHDCVSCQNLEMTLLGLRQSKDHLCYVGTYNGVPCREVYYVSVLEVHYRRLCTRLFLYSWEKARLTLVILFLLPNPTRRLNAKQQTPYHHLL